MRTFYFLFLFGFYVSGFGLQTQDTIQLNDILVSTRIINEYSTGQNIQLVKDSVFQKQPSNPASFFLFNSPIHIKENGFGMVASPSFRGTLASHTLVLWNGVPINSQLNGQVDFNAFNILGYDDVLIRPGGGSLLYGSGGIGGTIHLNQDWKGERRFQGQVLSTVGSFNSYRNLVKVDGKEDRLSYKFSVSHNYSDNDFKIKNSDKRNVNGKYQNISFNYGLKYLIDNKNKLEFFGELYDGDRYLSILRPSETQSKYLDKNFRSLIVWAMDGRKNHHYFRAAYLREYYQYFQNRYSNTYSFGNSNTYLASYESEIILGNSIKVKPLLSLNNVVGSGSDLENPQFYTATSAVEFKQTINDLKYEVGLRYERHSVYKGQILGQIGLEYKTINLHKLKLHFSKNFRAPTLNDLYWNNSGNLDLNPEKSYQAELTNELRFDDITLLFTAFYNDIKNLIQWRPTSSGLWSPINVGKVNTYGFEINGRYKREFGKVRFFINQLTSYTISKDVATDNFLIYSPKWISNTQLQANYRRITTNLQLHYTGNVFTTTNNSASLDPFFITNLSFDYTFGKGRNFRFGLNVNNLFDCNYQTIEYRPMPGRYYQLVLNLKY